MQHALIVSPTALGSRPPTATASRTGSFCPRCRGRASRSCTGSRRSHPRGRSRARARPRRGPGSQRIRPVTASTHTAQPPCVHALATGSLQAERAQALRALSATHHVVLNASDKLQDARGSLGAPDDGSGATPGSKHARGTGYGGRFRRLGCSRHRYCGHVCPRL